MFLFAKTISELILLFKYFVFAKIKLKSGSIKLISFALFLNIDSGIEDVVDH